MPDNEEFNKIIDHVDEDGKTCKAMKLAIPVARPVAGGTFAAIVYAFIIVGMILPFSYPALAVWSLMGLGVAALGWFTLYRFASSVATQNINNLKLLEGLFFAQGKMMEHYLTENKDKIEGTKDDETCLSKDTMENEGGPPEPK
jgi:hypothetical protein